MTDTALDGAAVVRAAGAETLVVGSNTLQLLLDSIATGGALSAHRVHLHDGADGANPHRHSRSSEVFYTLDGSVDLLAGERTLTATEGDLIVVPPGVAHAFAASWGCDAELLVIITPGIERFDFFRQLIRVQAGLAGATDFVKSQQLYDTYGADSPEWHRARTAPNNEKKK